MKNILSLLVVVFLIGGCSKENGVETDWEKHNLKGKVKSIKESEIGDIDEGYSVNENKIYKYNNKGNLIEEASYESDGDLFWKTTYHFDKNGNKVERNYISPNGSIGVDKYGKKIVPASNKPNGSLVFKYIYKYDNNGNKVEEAKYKPDGSLMEKTTFKYDKNDEITNVYTYDPFEKQIYKTSYQKKYYSNGIQKEKSLYNASGELKATYKYDDNGNETEEAIYNSDGSLSYKHIYKYDNNGNKIEFAFYRKSNDSLTLEVKETYKYDYKGNLTESTVYNLGHSLSSKYNFEYEYDSKGNWTKWVSFKNKNEITKYSLTKERKIEYYD
ncbi:MAG: hypothetical protein CMP67_10060 [Flavobacteriales bacterium]|nr:hypothetical protein [Flavobacteriales bacterium]|tara:strand:+ start:225 stop:1208 length:984 start_codon:yes stop_codon:yes gene_type:complete